MAVEFDGLVDSSDEISIRFHAALDGYRQHRHDEDEPTFRRELAEHYVQAVPENPLDHSRVLSTIHWRAIERCAQGEPYKEEERRESPFEVQDIHTKNLRVYVADDVQCWKLFTIFVRPDGSFHRVSLAERLAFGGDFHYSFHPSGVVHDTDPSGHKRYAALYWPTFRELDIAPMGGIGISPESFRDASLDSLRRPAIPQSGLTFEIPWKADMFYVEMWLGKAEQLRDPRILRERMVPVASDQIEKIEFFRMATFLDPKDNQTFDIDFAVAQIVRADDWKAGHAVTS